MTSQHLFSPKMNTHVHVYIHTDTQTHINTHYLRCQWTDG